MRSFLVLFLRELDSRRLVLLASPLFALASILAALLVPSSAGSFGEICGTIAVALAMLWMVLLSVGLGATCLARDLPGDAETLGRAGRA